MPTKVSKRYQNVTNVKSEGATYTPKCLADFVAAQAVRASRETLAGRGTVKLLDPAVGDGQLLLSLLENWPTPRRSERIEVYGFDTSNDAIAAAQARLREHFPSVILNLAVGDFLNFALQHLQERQRPLLGSAAGEHELFDVVIANPPYVRTQIMGSTQSQILARHFGLTGRVDLYHAFLVAMAAVLRRDGTGAIIVSNRFMTTKGGASVREAVRANFTVKSVWDLGDTKLFDAAVLPAVLLLQGPDHSQLEAPTFTSIYESDVSDADTLAADPIDALSHSGAVTIQDGRTFVIQHGTLDLNSSSPSVWRLSTETNDAWLARVRQYTWRRFGDIGKVRVGVKTCADNVFIRSDWDSLQEESRPELLRLLTTHHVARRFRALDAKPRRQILYPHTAIEGCRTPVDLQNYPAALRYLQEHRRRLESRSYVLSAGRQWYEIWVPQDPDGWAAPKLVFRDITERPCFWVDLEGTVVNGDCYWITSGAQERADLLWLAAAVGNSTFIETYYDHSFHNKLYSGRRRFITQYVEQFPLPDSSAEPAVEIVAATRQLYGDPEQSGYDHVNALVWEAFGLGATEK